MNRIIANSASAPPKQQQAQRQALEPSAGLTLVHQSLRAGIPIHAMEQMREFNMVHYDFPLVKMSAMVDAALPAILMEERNIVKAEMKAAGFFALVFGGTTLQNDVSFFVARYRYRGEVKSKCLAVKQVERSKDVIPLCRLIKTVFSHSGLDITQGSGQGIFLYIEYFLLFPSI